MKEGATDNESLLGKRVVSTLIADHHFEGKHLYLDKDNFFPSLSLHYYLQMDEYEACFSGVQ